MTTILRSALFAALTSAAACSPSVSSSVDCEGDQCDESSFELCAAVRGNGQLVTAHFASLARIVEQYGTIDAAAGGSSASISIFLMESMQQNPQVSDCDGVPCSEQEERARAALLLKSFPGYVQHLGSTDEAAAVMNLMPLVQKIQSAGLEELAESDIAAATESLVALLESPDLVDLINPAVIGLLQNSPNPEMHFNDVMAGVKNLGAFKADTDQILIRPGVISFAGLADKIGRGADFYAGYGPSDEDAMEDFMSACAVPGIGRMWFEVAQMPAGELSSVEVNCGERFDILLGNYREALRDAPSFQSRVDEPVGEHMASLITTAVLEGESAASLRQAMIDYQNAVPTNFEPNFSEVSFGYWGQAQHLELVEANDRDFADSKTNRFRSLGQKTWKTALSLSPAEPGLSSALPIDEELVSVGGWSDLHPTQVLRNLGCEKTVYVTREGNDSPFAIDVARLVGMDDEAQQELYNLDNAFSSFSQALEDVDAVWCTDWDSLSGPQVLELTLGGHGAPMVVNDHSSSPIAPNGDDRADHSGFFGTYDNSSDSGSRGCQSR